MIGSSLSKIDMILRTCSTAGIAVSVLVCAWSLLIIWPLHVVGFKGETDPLYSCYIWFHASRSWWLHSLGLCEDFVFMYTFSNGIIHRRTRDPGGGVKIIYCLRQSELISIISCSSTKLKLLFAILRFANLRHELSLNFGPTWPILDIHYIKPTTNYPWSRY